ncbi:prepilin-type N-terminal cleavage/methylation domain-containing protein [bacterium]|nr:prepilin-type N-terminal cleavage/methylation domain-containing protein [bacterium]
MRIFNRRRGFTLIELVISSVILLLMLFGCYEALVLARKYHQKLSDSSQIQQETMSVLSRLERNLACASAESLEVSPDHGAMRFISARGDNEFFDLDPTSGTPLWHRWVGFYLDGTSLIWKEATIAPSTSLPGFFPSIDDIKLDTTARKVELSKQVESVYFEDGATTITIKLVTRSAAPKSNGLTVLTHVHLSQ